MSNESRGNSIDALDILNLLKIGNYFYHQFLQEYLIAEVIIPSMNVSNAVLFLKDCFANLEDSSFA